MNRKQQGIIGQLARIRERANQVIERELAARGLAGILPAHGSALAFLFRQERPVAIKAVVEATGRVKSTVTGIVNTLVRHGYLRKLACQQDSRVRRVELTEKGRALREDFEDISRTLQKKVYGRMPQADRRKLVELLSDVETNLAS